MPDPFNVFDSLDPFSRLNAFPRGRPQAAYPPLDDADTETAIQHLTRGTLGTLGYVGSTLDKLTGARAIRGVLGGKPRELLSVLPGSDIFGATNEEDTVRGEDLLRQVGYDPSKGNWLERNLVGPAVEIGLDPSTYAGGIGAITKLGKIAGKTAPVARSLDAVRAGQRSLHPLVGAAEYGAQKLGLSTPAEPAVQRAAANLAEWTGGKVGAGARGLNVGVRKTVPGVARAEDFLAPYAAKVGVVHKSLFDVPSGDVPEAVAQQASRTMYPAKQARNVRIGEREVDAYAKLNAVMKQTGMSKPEAQRYLRQMGERVPVSGPEGRVVESLAPEATDLLSQIRSSVKEEGVPGFIGPSFQPHLLQQLGHTVNPDIYQYGPTKASALEPLSRELIGLGRTEPYTAEMAAGLRSKLLDDPNVDYVLKQRYKPGGGGGGISGQGSKQFSTTHGSFIRRSKNWRDWLGGVIAQEDLMVPSLAGAARTWAPRKINEYLLADQLGRLVAHGTESLTPEMLTEHMKRAVDMQRTLKNVPKANILGGPSAIERAAAGISDVPVTRQPFIDPDVIRANALRAQRANKVTSSAGAIMDMIRMSHPMAQGLESDMPVTEVLRRTGLDTKVGIDRALEAVGISRPQRATWLRAKRQALVPEVPIERPVGVQHLEGQPGVRRFLQEGMDPEDPVAQLREFLDPEGGHDVPGLLSWLRTGQDTAVERLRNEMAPGPPFQGAVDALRQEIAPQRFPGFARRPRPAASLPRVNVANALKEMLQGYQMPLEQANAASRVMTGWHLPEALKPLVAASDWMMNKFKTGAYSIWPGSLGRNIGSGMEENLVEAGMTPFSPMRGRANRYLEGKPVDLGIPDLAHLTPDEQRIAITREMYPRGIIGPGQGEISERVGDVAPTRFGLMPTDRDPFAPRQGYGQIYGQLISSVREKGLRGLLDLGQIGKAAGQLAEERLRVPEYLHLRASGHTPDITQNIVERTHFNYGNLTNFEQHVLKRLIPFYTFSRFNIPKQINRAIARPATIAGPIRFSGMNAPSGEGYVPEYLRTGLALPLPGLVAGQSRYLSSLGLPMEEAFGRLKLGATPMETAAKTMQGLLGSLRPELRMPLEVATGKQFFTGRDLRDLHVGKIEQVLSGGNEALGRAISEGASATPLSRAISTANRLLDERKWQGLPFSPAVALGLPLASGIRISDVDAEKWKAIDARNQIARELAASQHIREHRDFYVPKDVRAAGKVTPEEAYALRTYAALQKRAKEAAEQQRRVGVRVGQ